MTTIKKLLAAAFAATALLGKVGKAVTTRNWATVLKLHALAASRSAQPVAHLDDPGGQPR